MAKRSKAPRREHRSLAARPGSGWTEHSDQSEELYLLYDHLVRSRDRLADLPPVTPQDMERVDRARHEVIFHVLTPPLHVKSDLPATAEQRAALVAAANDRKGDLFVGLVALVAQKVAVAESGRATRTGTLDVLRDALDIITFDYRTAKRDVVAMLRDLREDLDGRLAYVKGFRATGYRFLEKPELYKSRADKRERADHFFERVYRPHVRRGLTQADIRLIDPAYYNVLHVWCSRHGRAMSSLVPASRARH